MGRHSAEQTETVELPRVAGGGRHRGPGRASRKTRRAADRKPWRHRVKARTHRSTPRLQTAVLVGLAAFSIGTAFVGTGGDAVETVRPSQAETGTWVEIRPGSTTGAPGGRWVEPTPPLTGLLTPSPRRTSGSPATSSGGSSPGGSSPARVAPPGGSPPAPSLTSPGSGGSTSPSTPAADPTSSTPSPIPAPTAVRKRCRGQR